MKGDVGYIAQVEPFRFLLNDVRAMATAEWQETEQGMFGDEFNPNWDGYLAADLDGCFFAISLRAGMVSTKVFPVVGYALYFTRSSNQMMHHTLAWEDAFYVLPEHRQGMLASWFLQRIEQILKGRGVSLWIMADKQFSGGRSLEPLYRRVGLVPFGVTYAKRLSAGDRT